MKNTFFSLIFFGLLNISLLADIITVSNNPKVPAQYDNITSAIENASAGDTIHIQPSATNYGAVNVTKSLVVIGGGFFNNQEYYTGLESSLGLVTIFQEADQTVIADFFINAVLIKSENHQDSHDNISLIHNAIGRIDFEIANNESSFTGNNISIRNNIITNINFNEWNGVQSNAKINIENNIIGRIRDAGGENILIKNNLINPNLSGPTIAFFNINECIISSNIFLGNSVREIGTSNTSDCIYDRNLSFLTVDDFSSPSENNNVFTENISLTNPGDLLFDENITFNSLGQIMGLNFNLVEGSQAIENGSDGTDIGVLGGNFPFNHIARFSYPQVNSIEINNPVLGQDSKLIFKIKASYPDGN